MLQAMPEIGAGRNNQSYGCESRIFTRLHNRNPVQQPELHSHKHSGKPRPATPSSLRRRTFDGPEIPKAGPAAEALRHRPKNKRPNALKSNIPSKNHHTPDRNIRHIRSYSGTVTSQSKPYIPTELLSIADEQLQTALKQAERCRQQESTRQRHARHHNQQRPQKIFAQTFHLLRR